jgi:hypothetical protein
MWFQKVLGQFSTRGFEMTEKGLTDSDSGSELIPCLEKKLAFVKELSSITETLRDKVQKGEISAVTTLLAERQELIDQIGRVEEQIQKIAPQNPVRDFTDRMDPISRTIREMLEETILFDKECAAQMKFWQDETKGELIRMRRGLKAVQSYTGRLTGPPKFLDRTR